MIRSFIPITVCSAVGFRCFNSALNFNFVPRPSGKYAGTDSHRWRNATTSLVCAFITACIVVYCLFNHPGLWSEPETYYAVAVEVVIGIVSGYLIYDTRDLMAHNHFSRIWSLIAHHVITFIGCIIFISERKALGIIVMGLLSEISAIFLHSRQLLLMYGFSKRSLFYSVHSFFNLATFILLRLIPVTYAMYCSFTMTTSTIPVYIAPVLPFMTTFILAVNIVLLGRLLRSDFLRKDGKDGHVMDN